MFYSLVFVTFVSVCFFSSNASPVAERGLCERYPHLGICALRVDLDQAIREVEYLFHVIERQQLQPADQPHEGMISGKDKRKSAFVRFGKRSDSALFKDDSSAEQQADLFISSRPTRKSSFVRFG